MDGRTDGQTYGQTDVCTAVCMDVQTNYPCILQDIVPLGPLPKTGTGWRQRDKLGKGIAFLTGF